MLKLLYFFATARIVLSSAFSWSRVKYGTGLAVNRNAESGLEDLGLNQEEINSLFPSHLEKYASNKPDCFKLAVHNVNCDDVEQDEGVRVSIAIRLTLCELRTAMYTSIPMECNRFQNTPEEGDRSCVEALSRSTQAWSSYSGYLRDVPRLCESYRYWGDNDKAKQIYRNITTEKMSLLTHLKKRDEAVEREFSRMLKNLDLSMGNGLTQIMDALRMMVREEREHGNVVREQGILSLQSGVQDLISQYTAMLPELHRETTQRFQVEVAGMIDVLKTAQSDFFYLAREMHLMDASVTDLTTILSTSTQTLSSLITNISYSVDGLGQRVANTHSDLEDMKIQINQTKEEVMTSMKEIGSFHVEFGWRWGLQWILDRIWQGGYPVEIGWFVILRGLLLLGGIGVWFLRGLMTASLSVIYFLRSFRRQKHNSNNGNGIPPLSPPPSYSDNIQGFAPVGGYSSVGTVGSYEDSARFIDPRISRRMMGSKAPRVALRRLR